MSDTPPDAGQTPPGAGQTPPGAGQTPPGAGQAPPDAGLTQPDAGQAPPDAGLTQPGAGQAPPDAGLTQPEASRLALIAEATKRAGLIWITVPGHGVTGGAGAGAGEAVPGRPRAAWHVWRDAAYVLTGPGEQDVPGLGDASQVTVTVPSKDTGGLLVRWTAQVSRVEPGSAEWCGIIGALLAARLNEPASPGAPPAVQRWTRTGAVYRLSPAAPFDAGCDAP